MDIQVLSPRTYTRIIKISAQQEEVSRRYKEILAEVAKDFDMPGFRKGKVPMNLVEKIHGVTIAEELKERLLKEGFSEARSRENFQPLMSPRIEKDVILVPGFDFDAEISVEVKAPIELRQYKGMNLTKHVKPVTDDEVDATVQNLRERAAHLEPVEDRGSQPGDYVLVDFQPKGEKKPTKRVLLLDNKITITALGRKQGETFEGHFEFPKDFPDRELAGNIYDAIVTIIELKKVVLPELNEEFFADFGPEITDLEKLKGVIRKELERAHELEAEKVLRKRAKEELVIRNPFEISPMLIDLAVDDVMAEYFKVEELSEEQKTRIREELRPNVVRDISAEFILEEIAKVENLKVEDSEIKERVAKIARSNRVEPEALYKYWRKEEKLDSVKRDLLNEKALELVIANSNIEKI